MDREISTGLFCREQAIAVENAIDAAMAQPVRHILQVDAIVHPLLYDAGSSVFSSGWFDMIAESQLLEDTS